MTTNQEGRQAAIRDSTSTAYGVAADWHALFDDAGISAGTFNERLLAWINAELSASYSNLVSAMQAYAEDAGYDGWEDMATLVLAMNGAETLLDGETQGLAFDFTDQSALIIDTGTPANNYDSTGIVSNGSLVGPSGKLTYTSPSNKLTRQSDGYYKYQAHNLCTYSEDFSNAAWADASMTNTASTLVLNAASALTTSAVGLWTNTSIYTSQQITTATGATYEYAIEVASGSGLSHIQIRVGNNAPLNPPITYSGQNSTVLVRLSDGVVADGHASVYTVTDLGDGYYRISVKFTATTTSAYCGIWCWNSSQISSAAGTEFYNVRKAHVRRYPANTDYIKTTSAAKYALPLEYDTSGNCIGLLVEEARTNLCYPSRFPTGITGVFTTDPNNSTAAIDATSPDGLTNGTTLTATASITESRWRAALTHSNNTAYTWSMYVKQPSTNAATYAYMRALAVTSGGTPAVDGAWFNITTGTTATKGSGITSSSITSVGNGWYRCAITATTGNPIVNNLVDFGFCNADAAVTTTAGQKMIFWGAQVEAGSFPTSPILTYGSSATRNADNISIATSAFPHSDATQSVYVSYTPNFASDGGVRNVVSLNDGGNTEIIYIYSDDSVGRNKFTITDGGVAQCNITNTASPPVAGTEQKLALSYAANDIAACVNGGTVQTDTSATMPTVTQLNIGARYSATQHIGSGIVTQLSVVPRAKSDAELQTETA